MMILYICDNMDCDNKIKKYFKNAADIPTTIDCGECGKGKLTRQLSSPSTRSTVIIDNGRQWRQVEVDSTIIEQTKEKLDKEGK